MNTCALSIRGEISDISTPFRSCRFILTAQGQSVVHDIRFD